MSSAEILPSSGSATYMRFEWGSKAMLPTGEAVRQSKLEWEPTWARESPVWA